MSKDKTKKNGGPTIITHANTSHLSSMVIGNGHSIMASYIPPSIGAKTFVENYYEWVKPTNQSIQSFGLFGGDIDYNTYYPNLDASELQPKEEEFISPVFRLLSACIVSKNWNPTDFSKDGVLKASMKMLLGQTVNCDHETNIGNAIGSVSAVYWQEDYKDGNITIPAGINGTLLIDGKANPRIARGILMDPPSIHSNSVTVQFKWEKSHPSLSDEDFYYKLGSYDKKGEQIRRIVTEVVRYMETSLVNHGADPYAQKIQDGKIVNPQYANRVYSSFQEYEEKESKTYTFSSFKDQNSDDTSLDNNKQFINSNSMNELEKFLEALFGEQGILSLAEGTELNQENALAAIRSLSEARNTLSTQLEAANISLNEVKASLAEKENQITAMQSLYEIGKNHFASLREETVNVYKKLKGDSADESMISLINAETTGITTVTSLLKDYNQQLEEKFPMKCKDCGSTNINRASSSEESKTDDKELHETEDNILNNIQKLYKNKIKS